MKINVTSDLDTPSPVKAVTFVPNSAASWLGAIVLLTEDEALYRTNGQSSTPVKISDGPYTDIFGLARQAQPGVFLALEPSGRMDAFIEIDNDGNFEPIPLNLDGTAVSKFCSQSTPQDKAFWGFSDSGDISKFTISVKNNEAVDLTETETISLPDGSQSIACVNSADDSLWVLTDKALFQHNETGWETLPFPDAANLAALPGTDGFISTQADATTILFTEGQQTQAIALTNGLSIRGLDKISYVTVTDVNMGSAFSEGLVIAVDSDSNRLVMVARDYFLNEIRLTE